MKRVTKFFLALAVVASPMVFTSCDDDDPWNNGYYYDDLVTNAVRNYNYKYPNGSDYYTAYNWFYYNYPDAYTEEFYQFMDAIGSGRSAYWNYYNQGGYNWNNNYNGQQNSQNSQLVAEAQTLTGEWEGDVTYEYTDDKTKQRKRDRFTANMKFFQYNSSANSLSGNGVEVDTDAQGNQQTLAFSWYVNNDGNIYLKYSRSGTVFVLDSKDKREGFHLGYESAKGCDTFYGTAYSTNTTDVMKFDLVRQRPASAKAAPGVQTRAASQVSFGSARQNDYANSSTGAVSRLHVR